MGDTEQATQHPSGAVDDDARRHILVVEDEPSTADVLTTYFDSLGYTVSQASWGNDAVRLAVETQPDLVVLDIHLPDIDGYEVCLRLRNQTRTKHTPIIFLTERRERVDRLTGLEIGAVDYITKPFDFKELQFRVRNALQRSNRETLLHPITGLPTSTLIEEELAHVAEDEDLEMLAVVLRGMPAFHDAYGFVTHDDVLRAVALILRNNTAEMMDTDLFIGQLDFYQYVVVAPSGQAAYVLMGRLDQRLNEAVSFFYPNQDWERGLLSDGSELPRIQFDIRLLATDSFTEPEGLLKLQKFLEKPEA